MVVSVLFWIKAIGLLPKFLGIEHSSTGQKNKSHSNLVPSEFKREFLEWFKNATVDKCAICLDFLPSAEKEQHSTMEGERPILGMACEVYHS